MFPDSGREKSRPVSFWEIVVKRQKMSKSPQVIVGVANKVMIMHLTQKRVCARILCVEASHEPDRRYQTVRNRRSVLGISGVHALARWGALPHLWHQGSFGHHPRNPRQE
jgi:hypothetical protein